MIGLGGISIVVISLFVMPFLNGYVGRLVRSRKSFSMSEKRMLDIYSSKFQQMATKGYIASIDSCVLRIFSHSSFNHLTSCLFAGFIFSQTMDSKSAFEAWTLGTVWSSVASGLWGQLMPHTTIGMSGAVYGLIGWNVMNIQRNKENEITISFVMSIVGLLFLIYEIIRMKQKFSILSRKSVSEINKMSKVKKKVIWVAHETHLGGIFGGILAQVLSQAYNKIQ
jgi:membrane associated rhomboid family serine protease